MTKLKLALLGCGDVAHRDYLPEFHRIANRAEIVAVCGRGKERAQFTADRHGISNVYTDYGRMLAETEADAIINLTPMQMHFETNLAILQASKHVYSEKTVATNSTQARQLGAQAKLRNLTMVCAPCISVWPQIKLAGELLDAGVIGEVHSARGIGLGGVPPWAGFTSDPSPFFARGGGPQRDMGVYPLHALTHFLGPVKGVGAICKKAQPSGFVVAEGPFAGTHVPMQEDDTWLMLLDHHGGAISVMEANNSVQDTQAPQLELFGLHGTIALNLIDGSAPIQVTSTIRDWQRREIEAPHVRARGPDHILGVEHLVECLSSYKTPILNIGHATHVIEIIDAAAVASREGRTIQLTTTF